MTNQAKIETEQKKIYTFLDFEINPNLREIHQVKAPLKISKKSFDILLLLIEKQGNVVTKDEIINRVWPNQIVTDAALNKQITRLRNDLSINQSTEHPIIETVRGVGVKLIPTVQIKPFKTPSSTSKKSLWLAPIIVVLLMYITNYYFLSNPQRQEPLPTTKTTESKSFNIVLMPAKKAVDWLNVGGLGYLSTQLHQHQEIQSIGPKIKWFDQGDNLARAIDISQREGIDFVLTVNNLKKDEGYKTDLLLRNKEGILAKQSMQAESLAVLFDKIDSWVTRQLKITEKLSKGELNNYHPTDFALESYLRGRELALYKSYSKATLLFQTAINEDPLFFKARLALADAESELGNYTKSLALIDVMLNRKDFDKRLFNHLYTIKAKNLMFLNKYDEAHQALDKSIQISKQLHDYSTLVRAMTVKVVIDANTNNISQKTIDLLLKQLEILREHKPDPGLIALASSNLAGMYQNLGQLQSAIKYAKVATDMYNILNDDHGIVFSNTVLARIYNSMGDIGKALLVLDKIDATYQKLDGLQVPRLYLQYKTENQTYFGLKKEALITINKLQNLSLTHTDLTAKVIALALLADLNIIYEDYSAAKLNIKQLLEINQSKPSGYVSAYKNIIFAYDLYIYALTEESDKARAKLNAYIQDNPSFSKGYSKEIKNIEAIILNKEGFKTEAVKIYRELMDEYTQSNQAINTLYTGYKLLDIQWQNNRQDYIKTMNYLDEIAIFKYPIHKYKAQYLADRKEYTSAYVMMEGLKSKANEFWTTDDQILLEQYQELAKNKGL